MTTGVTRSPDVSGGSGGYLDPHPTEALKQLSHNPVHLRNLLDCRLSPCAGEGVEENYVSGILRNNGCAACKGGIRDRHQGGHIKPALPREMR